MNTHPPKKGKPVFSMDEENRREAKIILKGCLLTPIAIILGYFAIHLLLDIFGFLSENDWIGDLLEALFDVAQHEVQEETTTYGGAAKSFAAGACGAGQHYSVIICAMGMAMVAAEAI